MDAISQTTFSRVFSSMKNFSILIKFSLKYVRRGPIDNNPALVQILAWRRSGDKPLSEPMMISLPTHICVTRPQWVNKLIYLFIWVWITYSICTRTRTRAHTYLVYKMVRVLHCIISCYAMSLRMTRDRKSVMYMRSSRNVKSRVLIYRV